MHATNPFIIGEVLFDCFPGARRVLGGAPFNVACHLAAFGADPLFLSAVGKDEMGDEILARMESRRMRTEGLQRLEGIATGRVDVHNAETNPSYVFPDKSAWDCVSRTAIPTDLKPALLYQGSLFLRREQSRETSLSLAQDLDCPRFVDVNLRTPWFTPERIQKLVTGVHCLKVSEEELSQLAEWFGLPPNRPLAETAGALLEAATLNHLFITRGKQGAVWFTAEGSTFEAPAAPAEHLVDTVGAGDASASVAILGLLRAWPIEVLLERSMQFAARICQIAGAIPDHEELYHDVSRNWN